MRSVETIITFHGARGRAPLPGAHVALALSGLVSLLVVVAVATRAGQAGGLLSAGPWLPDALVDAGLFALTACGVVSALILAVALRPRRRRKRHPGDPPDEVVERPPVGWRERLALFAVPLFAAAALLALFASLALRAPGQAPSANIFGNVARPLPPSSGELPPPAGVAAPSPQLSWAAPALALAVLGAVAGAIALRERLPKSELPGGRSVLAAAVSDALDDALRQLAQETQPRRAVIVAYAAMERALERGGVPRHRSEAPFEYLMRALRQVHVNGAALQQLTDLYEHARFSHHDVYPRMRDDAIAALQTIRGDLEAQSRERGDGT